MVFITVILNFFMILQGLGVSKTILKEKSRPENATKRRLIWIEKHPLLTKFFLSIIHCY